MTAHAVGEAAGQVLERLDGRPDLATVFVTAGHAGALEDVASAVRSILQPTTLVGCAAESVLANGWEVEGSAAIVVWAGQVGPVVPVHLRLVRTADGTGLTGWRAHPPFEPQSLLLFADPFSFPAESFFRGLGQQSPGLPVVGGNASAARGPGGCSSARTRARCASASSRSTRSSSTSRRSGSTSRAAPRKRA